MSVDTGQSGACWCDARLPEMLAAIRTVVEEETPSGDKARP